jgi:hypothetical protein
MNKFGKLLSIQIGRMFRATAKIIAHERRLDFGGDDIDGARWPGRGNRCLTTAEINHACGGMIVKLRILAHLRCSFCPEPDGENDSTAADFIPVMCFDGSKV